MKTINKNVYMIIYAINNITKEWLKQTNDYIKENGVDIITHNKDNAIKIRYDTATAKRGEEYEKELALLQAKYPPINTNEKKQVMQITLDRDTEDYAKQLLSNFENTNEIILQKVGSTIKTLKPKRKR